MGQKAKNAGKKKSKVASNKPQSKTYGAISLVGNPRQPPTKQWMEEVDSMLKDNFSAAASVEKCKIGRACVRQTDLVKNATKFIPYPEYKDLWNSPRV